jgi:hypothetical protein
MAMRPLMHRSQTWSESYALRNLATPPENGTRANRKMRRTIAEAQACVAFMPNGEFDELVVSRIFRTLGRWPAPIKRSSRCAA